MNDDVWTRREIESPCKKICLMHPHEDICIGCYRTRLEVAKWSRYSPEERRVIMDALPERESRVAGRRRGGRAARIRGAD